MRLLLSSLLVCACLAGDSAQAQIDNLLTNPDFDTDTAGWSCEQASGPFTVEPANRPEVECTRASDDVDGLPESGSGEVSLDGFSDSLIRAQIVQCVPVEELRRYLVRGALRPLSTNRRSGQLDFRWYRDPGCQGVDLGWDTIGVNGSSTFEVLEDHVFSPVGAESAKYTVIAFALTDEQHRVQVDAALVPEPGAAGQLAALFVAAATLARRQRRRATR